MKFVTDRQTDRQTAKRRVKHNLHGGGDSLKSAMKAPETLNYIILKILSMFQFKYIVNLYPKHFSLNLLRIFAKMSFHISTLLYPINVTV